MTHKILYIEDELFLASIVKETLSRNNFEILHLSDGSNALKEIINFNPDIILLDVMLHKIDGFTLGKNIKKAHPNIPIIYLTAKDQIDDLEEGFTSGGTDYIKKPFSIKELILRINNQLNIISTKHKFQSSKEISPIYNIGRFKYYPYKLLLEHEIQKIRISNREAEVLNILCQHPNEILEKKQLMKLAWEDDNFFISRNLDVYISKLRSYFGQNNGVSIITIKGKGYLFNIE